MDKCFLTGLIGVISLFGCVEEPTVAVREPASVPNSYASCQESVNIGNRILQQSLGNNSKQNDILTREGLISKAIANQESSIDSSLQLLHEVSARQSRLECLITTVSIQQQCTMYLRNEPGGLQFDQDMRVCLTQLNNQQQESCKDIN